MERVQLDPADYWKLMSLGRDMENAALKASLVTGQAKAARDAFAKELAGKYPDFVPDNAHYRSDDATCSLIREK